jgi:hypothetical protein
LKWSRSAFKLLQDPALPGHEMASEPKRPDDDNIVSLREARARQAAQAKAERDKAERNKSGTTKPEQKLPVLLIFFGLLAVLVAYKFLLG